MLHRTVLKISSHISQFVFDDRNLKALKIPTLAQHRDTIPNLGELYTYWKDRDFKLVLLAIHTVGFVKPRRNINTAIYILVWLIFPFGT